NLSALFDQLWASRQQIVHHLVIKGGARCIPSFLLFPGRLPLAPRDLRTVPREMLRSRICLVFMTPLQVTERIRFLRLWWNSGSQRDGRHCSWLCRPQKEEEGTIAGKRASIFLGQEADNRRGPAHLCS